MFFIARLKSCPICGKIHAGVCHNKKDTHIDTKERKFRKSAEWRRVREQVLERDKYCCQICLQHGIINANKSHHVHHIQSLHSNVGWDLRSDTKNLIVLCSDCHAKTHSGDYSTIDIQNLVNDKYDK